jgi:hypothetical protein
LVPIKFRINDRLTSQTTRKGINFTHSHTAIGIELYSATIANIRKT